MDWEAVYTRLEAVPYTILAVIIYTAGNTQKVGVSQRQGGAAEKWHTGVSPHFAFVRFSVVRVSPLCAGACIWCCNHDAGNKWFGFPITHGEVILRWQTLQPEW